MSPPKEHKELSEMEATANQDEPISDRQQSKELQKEETLPQCSPLSLFFRNLPTPQADCDMVPQTCSVVSTEPWGEELKRKTDSNPDDDGTPEKNSP